MANVEEFKSKMTCYVWACWIFAAFGGLMFGYDIGISGGVTGMDDFLKKFFHGVYERKLRAHEDNYCKYDDQLLQLFTSSLYMAALVASFFASKLCSVFGRRKTIFTASLFFITGAILCASAPVKWVLILGRILFGIGVGCGNEAVPLFLSEVAPVQHRGAVNILFQLFVTIGILIANMINYGTSFIHPHGWRISLGLAGVPGIILFLGSLYITDTPPSLIHRGHVESGLAALKKIRGVENVDAEFAQIAAGCEEAKKTTMKWKKVLGKSGIPALVVGNSIQIFQQFTGINAIMFYAPVLFQTLGFKSDASLASSLIIGAVNVCSTFVSIYLVDKVGRKKLLLQACVQMLISQVIIGVLLVTQLGSTGGLARGTATIVVLFVCTFVMSFAWSWGPMGWLIPTEIYPIETRPAGFAIAVSTNMIFTFVIAQAFLSMLCHMKAYIFFFFSAWIIVMGLFALFLLPETKGVPVEEIEERIWKTHPVWKFFYKMSE